ncbi:MAG TPA: polyprenyl synthetase family protein, partial [Clostridiales bacterium]|nr:polyprenyl synthetase family protein [Clostridiales bacterium]
ADLRRGKPTLRKAFGNKTAVICGDYLLSRSLALVTAAPDPKQYLDRRFQDYISFLCLGELNQLLNNNNFNLSLLQYFRIINGKTAALFEASFLAGAVTGGLSDADCQKFSRLGHIIGMIFQLTDDCLDFEADLSAAGKNVQTDYEQNVVTLPLIFALTADPVLKINLANAEAHGEKLPRSVINTSVTGSHGLDRTHRVVQDYGRKARTIINQLIMPESKRNDLESLLRKAMRTAS